MVHRFRIAAAGALLCTILGSCAPQIAAITPPRPPGPRPHTVTLTPPGLVCLDKLGERGAKFEIVAERVTANGCSVSNGVRLERVRVAFDKPVTVTCQMAIAWADFEEQVVQPAALRYFKRRVTFIRQLGSYSCRDIRGTRRLSEHAHGQALDIAGFDLDGGPKITVKDDWSGRGERSRFLQDVAKGACKLFNVVLTPKSGADHRDHIHVDIGPYPLCEA